MKTNVKRFLQSKAKKGFTLIELLVVIGILGILASALVATIDPFEQLKKANDANVKNILVEFNNATIRYYATHNAYPWDSAANGGGGCNTNTAPSEMQLSGTAGTSCVTALVGDNELKQSFSAATGDLAKIYVTYDSTNNLVIGCFQPQSKSGQNDANTKFNGDGTAGSGTKSCATDSLGNPANMNGGCFWCTR